MEKILDFLDSLPDNDGMKTAGMELVAQVKTEVKNKTPIGLAIIKLLSVVADSDSSIHAESDRLTRMTVINTTKLIKMELES